MRDFLRLTINLPLPGKINQLSAIVTGTIGI